MTLRIVVTGESGQVATSLKVLGQASEDLEVFCVSRPEIDLSVPASLMAPIRALRPDVIVSAAAYTNVDKAESEPDIAAVINGEAPGELARVANSLNIPIIHLSTDYVFAGDKDGWYDETDPTGPISSYGKSKLTGERRVAEETANHVILRTSWVYSPYGSNFVKTMLRLAQTRDEVSVVADQRGCPTFAPEMACAIVAVARRLVTDNDPGLRGVFNLTGGGDTTWAGFASAIFERTRALGEKVVKVNPIGTVDYPTPARRPANSRLSTGKILNRYGYNPERWESSLDSCLNHIITAVRAANGDRL